ncbi:hypothetical protein BCR32DRAFT_242998 [Anaeromyces robustus]|uniref:Lebercilin domain-containing protein n=1 Tax=Anaeromyces robustus TaxID=1754192 RepID=A0A1Y1XDW2_9FUNG|nr:hypothetical protein BCR32DRAFT_242998 [Anaeromyces robustus]|eukprot:ORX83948.1 hypothetical protein BCR32DRAFT_242998 [Anaeromyces robustus]
MNSKDKYSSNISLSGNKSKKNNKTNNDLITDNDSYQKNKHQQHHHHHSKHHHSNNSISDNKGKIESNDMNVSAINLKKHKQSSITGSTLSFKPNGKNGMGSKQSLTDKIKYRRTKLTQIDVNAGNYAEIIRLTSLLDEAYAKIRELTSENKKLATNQKVQERALKNTNELVGDYPKTIEKLMEDIRVLKAQNKKYIEKLVSVERAQVKKTAIQNTSDNNFELKEKNHRLHEEIEKQKQKLSEYEKRDENYQKVYDQLIKRTKLCKEKISENKLLVQKNQRLEKDIVKLREAYNILKKTVKIQNNSSSSTDKRKLSLSKPDINRNEMESNNTKGNDSITMKKTKSTIKEGDQKFFMPSQEETLKPSTLFKPNLYFSANCSPEPEEKEEIKETFSDNEITNDLHVENNTNGTKITNETNNGASIFEDNYDIDFYNDYAEENMKLNDSVLNIDEYIENNNNNNNIEEEINEDLDNKSNSIINEHDDSLSINNYSLNED